MFMMMPQKYTENAPQTLKLSNFTRSGHLFHRKQGWINSFTVFARFYPIYSL